MKITGRRFVLTSIASLIALHVQGEDTTTVATRTNVPAGFEALSQSQRSLIDVYYGNRYIGSQLATYGPTTIRFSDPTALVRLIGNISDPTIVIEGLTGELSTNTDKICRSADQANCGMMVPAISGVIFDENRFRADVFINQRFLKTRPANVGKYLPPSDADYSFMQMFSATLSGARGDDNNTIDSDDYTFYGTSVFAEGENSLYASWDYSKTQHFSLDAFYGQQDFEGVHYRIGLIDSEGFGFSFTSDRTLTGVRVGSSDNTRIDTQFSGGIPLDVFLPVRGRIEVLKNKRLIASYFMEAGSHQLNTSAFPSGAYDVEIKLLNEQGGLIKTETRFFAKEFNLPPANEWRYFMEAGKIMDRNTDKWLPQMTDQLLVRGGVSRRLTPTTSITTSAAINTENSLAELGLFNIGYFHELSPSIMIGNNSAYGANIIGRLSWGDVTFNGSYSQLWNDQYNNNLSTNTTDFSTLLGASFRQGSLSFNTSMFGGSISYGFSESQNANEGTTQTHAISYRTNLYRFEDLNVDLDTSYSMSNDDQVALFSVNFRLRDDRWSWRMTPRAERRWQGNNSTSRNENLSFSGTWNNDMPDSTVRANFGVETGREGERYTSRIEVGNSWGTGDIALNHVVDDFATTSYAASFSSSFITNGEYASIGGEHSAESALMIHVTGQEGDIFDVTVNGQRRGYAVAGHPSLVPLSPYDQYIVSINPTGTALYDFDERQRTVTLYPGNVVALNYDAVALQLLFGRLLYNGEPLRGAVLKGGQYPADSDDVGLFQMEVRHDKEAIEVVLDNGHVCSLPLPEQEDSVLRLGTVDLNKANCVHPTLKKSANNKVNATALSVLKV
ncbi:MAG: TcfC E-set like domain-containing protein [Endozoicomonas sp. (ex Botrylloides leachii)]|nr:TcfC E-set like domain-containing protein [Endozoicomonas sp. (ex Botrylloides leachii)]